MQTERMDVSRVQILQWTWAASSRFQRPLEALEAVICRLRATSLSSNTLGKCLENRNSNWESNLKAPKSKEINLVFSDFLPASVLQ